MNNTTMAKGTSTASGVPTVHWVEVRDASGRRQLEMRWSVPGAQQVALSHAA
jgi:hypothetical protein